MKLSDAKKQKLSMQACISPDNLSTRGDTFETMINPEDYTVDRTIEYVADGASGSGLKFKNIAASGLKLDFILDGTGVVKNFDVSLSGIKISDDVPTLVRKLEAVVYDYNGTNHAPNVVKVVWGDLVFYGRLTKLTTKYTLFKRTGKPLRAKVHCEFLNFISAQEEMARGKRSSPDLTHVITVKAGDSLPLLCNQVYGDSRHYLAIARHNKLIDFRALKPGLQLEFPPLA